MSRTSITQKQHEVYQKNVLTSEFLDEPIVLEPSFVFKTMIKIIKIKTKETMDVETRMHFLKIADTVVRMIEDISE